LQVSAGSGSTITLSWQNSFIKLQSGEDKSPCYREKRKKNVFKRAHTDIPALGLPDTIKPFFLYVYDRLGAVGVLTQLLGSWHCLVTYLSKQLDTDSPGWLLCLYILAASAVLVAKADKLTLRQKLTHSEFPTLF
jgi:hypothetical protein